MFRKESINCLHRHINGSVSMDRICAAGCRKHSSFVVFQVCLPELVAWIGCQCMHAPRDSVLSLRLTLQTLQLQVLLLVAKHPRSQGHPLVD